MAANGTADLLSSHSVEGTIDLPLKAVAWESEDGKVYLTF
jgi:uncharacterized protein (DUF302 family)